MSAVDDLTAWLTQIWDEQERDASDRHWSTTDSLVSPEEVFARIAADRQILAQREQVRLDIGEANADPRRQMNIPILVNVALALDTTIKHLGSAYAGRPGYREEWKP